MDFPHFASLGFLHPKRKVTEAWSESSLESEPHFHSGLIGNEEGSYPIFAHPCTRGIKLGYDVLRTPAFLRIENYIFHKSDFFQRRDRLFSYPRGIIPPPPPSLCLLCVRKVGVVCLAGVQTPCWEIGRLLGSGFWAFEYFWFDIRLCLFLHARINHKMF